MKRGVLFIFLIFLINFACALPAFPGAEGFGSDTIGGRGGAVYRVTSLADSGAGSLRACVEASGPRTCVFETGGTITLSSTLTINNPYIAIAGQSAPGGGITVRGGLIVETHDVVVRYLTVRGGTDTIGIHNYDSGNTYNIVIDHCSASWGTDEVLTSWYDAKNITWSYNMAYEGLLTHSMGTMVGGYKSGDTDDPTDPSRDFSVHHNYIASSNDRNGPYLRGGGYVDVVNNIVYNPGGGNFAYTAQEAGILLKVNLVKNYFKRGPAGGGGNGAWRTYQQSGAIGVETYVEGNYHSSMRTSDSQAEEDMVYSADRVYNNPDTTGSPNAHLVTTRWASPPTITEYNAFDGSLLDILTGVGNSQRLSCNGSWLSRRDSHDQRIIADFWDGTGALIDDPSDVGGYLTIASGTPCADSDSDGMPDAFENLIGLNPNSDDANGDHDGDGYTNIEEYLNGNNSGGTVVVCSEGEITSTCLCGGVEYSSGYCCSGLWQSTVCSTPEIVYHMIEAEDFTIGSPMQTGSDGNASGGAYIDTPSGTPETTTPTVEASYVVSIAEADDYLLWARVYGLDTSSDAVYIGFDSVFDRVYPSEMGIYEWVGIEVTHGSGNFEHSLTAGSHDVVIGHGEAQARVDAIIVTNNLTFVPTGVINPGSSCLSGADTDVDDVVSISELINFISAWKSGSVSIGELLTGISEWKNGC